MASGTAVRALKAAAIRGWTVLVVLLLCAGSARATDYTVKLDGSGQFRSIQACADGAKAGDTCLVSPGTYAERVVTKAAGTGENSRITFRAQGAATVQAFLIDHAYVTVQGFDITGYPAAANGLVGIRPGGDYCAIINNTIRDGITLQHGLYFIGNTTGAPDHCVVRGNTITNLKYTFLQTSGDGHLFENNTFQYLNNRDFIYLFGRNHIFRRNIFWLAPPVAGVSNHPDFVQTFGADGKECQNILFEENWIADIAGSGQFAYLKNGAGDLYEGKQYDNVRNITFRRNIISNVAMNAYPLLPGATFEHNTFYRLAYNAAGISFGSSLTRSSSFDLTIRNNVFLDVGYRSSAVNDGLTGFYGSNGASFDDEALAILVTGELATGGASTPRADGIFANLIATGYVNSNGSLLAPAKALATISQFVLDAAYDPYRQATYDHLRKAVANDARLRSTFSADYNYVAGSPTAGYPAKKSSGCVPGATFTTGNFCEARGLNGGNPDLANPANPLGPDGIPFTLDDGLKPLPTSKLCGAGEAGTDIGAYSCDPGKVFPGQPKAPSNVTIRR